MNNNKHKLGYNPNVLGRRRESGSKEIQCKWPVIINITSKFPYLEYMYVVCSMDHGDHFYFHCEFLILKCYLLCQTLRCWLSQMGSNDPSFCSIIIFRLKYSSCLDTRQPGNVFKKLDTRQSEILTNFLEMARLIPLRT